MAVLGVMLSAQLAVAQTSGWDVSIYPILAWVPLGIDIGIDVPPFEGGGGGSGDIIDGRFDGAFLGGLSLQKDRIRFDGDVLWAAVGGDRAERPVFSVDADIIYGHGAVGYMFAKDLYATVGVRRIAFKFDVKFADQANFERKPGVWDPVVGVAWHKKGGFVDLHASLEGGGFGVGSDVEWAGGFRFDLKPVRYFGITAGYNFLYFKVTDEALSRPFKFEQTLHGPVLGIGFYF
jgi:hypothetical protein